MLLIKGGTVHGTGLGTSDVLTRDGRIQSIAGNITATGGMEVLDASGLYVAPGFIDMHVHLREPGYEYKEDIMTGAAAAAAGGVTTCCCMPNTSPVADNGGVIRYIIERAANAAVRVLPYGAVTIGQRGGELTDFADLVLAGAVGLSDDGNPIQSADVMQRALREAQHCGVPIISHCEDADIVKDFAVNEGEVSRELGIEGRPAAAEEIMVARDALFAEETGARVHIAHVSTAGAVDIIRKAKAANIRITAETCPQYITLTERAILSRGALARVNPPLRTEADVKAIVEGLVDGTIDAIATDHAPHSKEEKDRPLEGAPSGMIGLETSLAIALTFLYHRGKMTLDKIVALMSSNPAGILGIEGGELREGARADIAIFDPREEWVVEPGKFRSKARNTPFSGMKLRGRVKYTIFGGRVVYRDQGAQ